MKNKGLITCLVGCAAAVILLIALLVSVGIWLGKKGEFDQTQTILDPETDCYVQLKLSSEEQALVEFFQELTAQSNRSNPLFKRFPQLEKFAQKDAEGDIKKLLPLRVEVQGIPGNEEIQVSVGFSLYNNIASIIYYFMKKAASEKGHLYEVGERSFIQIEESDGQSFFLSLDQNTVYVSNRRDAMQRMLGDSMQRSQELHSQQIELDHCDLSRPVYGFLARSGISNKTAGYFGLEEFIDWSWLTTDQVSRISFDFDVGADRKSVQGNLFLQCAPNADRMLIRQYLDQLQAKVESQPRAEISLEISETYDGFEMRLDIADLKLPQQPGIVIHKDSKNEED